MPEWWTYTLSDLQAFTLDTYYRLFDRYNRAIWPAQIVALALGAVIIVIRLRGADPRRSRLVAGVLAACWLWVAIGFHATRYATIHRGAEWFAWAFGFEALLLAWAGVVRGKLALDRRGSAAARIGLALFLFALLAQPLAGLLFGRGWRQVEVFGVAPDPTAVATLGVLLLAGGRARWELVTVPALWCMFSGATLLAMGTPASWLMVAAAALALVALGFGVRPEFSSGLDSGQA